MKPLLIVALLCSTASADAWIEFTAITGDDTEAGRTLLQVPSFGSDAGSLVGLDVAAYLTTPTLGYIQVADDSQSFDLSNLTLGIYGEFYREDVGGYDVRAVYYPPQVAEVPQGVPEPSSVALCLLGVIVAWRIHGKS